VAPDPDPESDRGPEPIGLLAGNNVKTLPRFRYRFYETSDVLRYQDPLRVILQYIEEVGILVILSCVRTQLQLMSNSGHLIVIWLLFMMTTWLVSPALYVHLFSGPSTAPHYL